MTTESIAGVGAALDEALRRSRDYFLRTQHPDGYWVGELETNVCMAAEYLMLTHFLGARDEERWRKLANYIRGQQRADGTWAIYFGGPPDINATVEAYFALKLAGVSADDPLMQKAREFVLSAGGVPKIADLHQDLACAFRTVGLAGRAGAAAGADVPAALVPAEHLRLRVMGAGDDRADADHPERAAGVPGAGERADR